MEVELPVLTNAACKKLESSFPEPQSPIDMSIQLCAGKKGSDTCQGDSGSYAVIIFIFNIKKQFFFEKKGGPLVAKDTDNKWYLVGVTSFGNGCGEMPGIFTRTYSYLDWIFKNIC